MAIFIHYNESSFSFRVDNSVISYLEWLISNERYALGDINLIFTNNPEILKLNRDYLNHDYYTDVIAFYYDELESLNGDIFISLDKVFENSKDYQTDFNHELLRVIFHGILHLVGYNDQTEEELEIIREKEDFYLKTYYLENN